MIRLFTRPLSRLFRRPDLILMRLVTAWIFTGALIVLVAGCDSRANNDSANHPMPPPEVARTVVQHLTTSATDTTRAFFVQIEFSGLASLGSNPINMLRRSVPGYGKISDPGSSPFFTNDDY